ncbi:dTDP-fucopyranose mutase [Dispira simplex]|nr:dTDP-fucopyranose mutase [Dispira simplex]
MRTRSGTTYIPTGTTPRTPRIRQRLQLERAVQTTGKTTRVKSPVSSKMASTAERHGRSSKHTGSPTPKRKSCKTLTSPDPGKSKTPEVSAQPSPQETNLAKRLSFKPQMPPPVQDSPPTSMDGPVSSSSSSFYYTPGEARSTESPLVARALSFQNQFSKADIALLGSKIKFAMVDDSDEDDSPTLVSEDTSVNEVDNQRQAKLRLARLTLQAHEAKAEVEHFRMTSLSQDGPVRTAPPVGVSTTLSKADNITGSDDDEVNETELSSLLSQARTALATASGTEDSSKAQDDQNPLLIHAMQLHNTMSSDLYIQTKGKNAPVTLANGGVATKENCNRAGKLVGSSDAYDVIMNHDMTNAELVKKPLASQEARKKTQEWFTMEIPIMTPELKQDLQLLSLRGALDQTRFHKRDKKRLTIPTEFQMGTVIEAPHEFYSARLTQKERKSTVVDQIMADTKVKSYLKRKVEEIGVNRKSGNKSWYNSRFKNKRSR